MKQQIYVDFEDLRYTLENSTQQVGQSIQGSGFKSTSTLIKDIKTRILSEIQKVNWKQQLKKDINIILQSMQRSAVFSANDEYKENMNQAVALVKGLVQGDSELSMEAYYFAIYYFFIILDEEHTRLFRFKYNVSLLKLPFNAFYRDGGVYDVDSRMKIVKVNNQPVEHYIEEILRVFPGKAFNQTMKIEEIVSQMNIYNPFFLIKSVTLQKTEKGKTINKTISDYVRFAKLNTECTMQHVDQTEMLMPEDMSFLYIAVDTFGWKTWNSRVLKQQGAKRDLIVLDMRNNFGGHLEYTFELIEDLMSIYASKRVLKELRAEFNSFVQSKVITDLYIYDIVLAYGVEEVRKKLKGMQSARYQIKSKILSQVYKAMQKGVITPPVVAVLINERCFSACRDAAIYLSAFPNVVIVGQDINLKNASGYLSAHGISHGEFIDFSLATIQPNFAKQVYVKLLPQIQASLQHSGIKHSIQLYNNLDLLQKLVRVKAKTQKRHSIFTPE